MVDTIEHEGVTQWRFSTRASRLFGYTASAFLRADGVLVDTGIPAARQVVAALLSAARVRGVMLTHHHEDHAGNVELVAARGIPIWMAAATVPLVTSVDRIRAYRRYTWAPMPPLASPVVPFTSGVLEPMPAPGHCADHHILWDPETRTLFSGDLFLGVAVRVAHHDEDPWALIESLERAAALEPVRMFDAHRGLVPEPAAALRAKAAWTRDLIATITARIAGGDSDARIVTSVLGGESVAGYASGGEYSRRNFVRAVRRRVARGDA
ncbi:MAG: MBL fold metallo-hydrolase [Gemmatimonadaceae bacterium]|nr:MBL fold metallo-hydrolase [Gemmatimonadaceae bacterium]